MSLIKEDPEESCISPKQTQKFRSLVRKHHLSDFKLSKSFAVPPASPRMTYRPIAPKPGSTLLNIPSPYLMHSLFVLPATNGDSFSSPMAATLSRPSTPGSTVANVINAPRSQPQVVGTTTVIAISPRKGALPAIVQTPTTSPLPILAIKPVTSPSWAPKKLTNVSCDSSSPTFNPSPTSIVCFASYDKLVPPCNAFVGCQRTAYAEMVVPQKKLHVNSTGYLKLLDLVPKGRNTDRSIIKNAETYSRGKTASCPSGSSSSGRTNSWHGPGPSSQWVPQFPMSAQLIVNQVSQNESTLRPSARLLTRLGKRLTRNQYSRFEKYRFPTPSVTDQPESGVDAIDSQNSSPSPPNPEVVKNGNNQLCDSVSSQLDPLIGHLVWRQKQLVDRWSSVKDLCPQRRCPFVPPSALALHRHLELGHNKLFSIVALSNKSDTLKTGSMEILPTEEHQTHERMAVDEQEQQGQSSATPTVDANNGLDMLDFFVVPLLPESIAERQPFKYLCPVCTRKKYTWNGISKHCVRKHPFITYQPVAQALSNVCTVCGFARGKLREVRPLVLVHHNCQPNSSGHRSLPWSNQDVPALACFMLFPSQLSRFHLPETLALHLIKTLDQVLSVHVGRLHLWTLRSMALRSVLAISSLYGEVKDSSVSLCDNMVVQVSDSGNNDLASSPDKSSRLSTTSVPPRILDAISAGCSNPLTIIATASRLTNNTASCSTSLRGGSSLVELQSGTTVTSTAGHTPMSFASMTLEQLTSTICQAKGNSRKRSVPVRYFQGSDVPAKKVATESYASSPILVHDDSNDVSSSVSEISVSCESATLGTSTTIFASPSTTVMSSTDVTVADSSVTTEKHILESEACRIMRQPQQQQRPVSPGAPRADIVTQSPCELCDVLVTTSGFHQRMHMLKSHQIKCAVVPGHHCFQCGKIFWTIQGRMIHCNISCAVCLSKDVCKSTLYAHMVIAHRAELITSMQDLPAVCLLCDKLFNATTRLVWHLYLQHWFRCPMETFHQDQHTSKTIQLNAADARFPSTRLQDFENFAYLINQPHGCQQREDLVHTLALPANIVVNSTPRDTAEQAPCYRCSICSTLFISVTHLDLHMMQAGHQYACPDCEYSCERGISLWTHHVKVHQAKSGSVNSGQTVVAPSSYRVMKMVNGMSVAASVIPSTCGTTDAQVSATSVVNTVPVLTTVGAPCPSGDGFDHSGTTGVSRATESIIQAPNPLSQFLRCEFCPVFCLTLDDLKTHHKSAHPSQTPFNRLSQPNVMIVPNFNAATAVPSSLPSVTSTSAVVHHRPLNLPAVISAPALVQPSACTALLATGSPSTVSLSTGNPLPGLALTSTATSTVVDSSGGAATVGLQNQNIVLAAIRYNNGPNSSDRRVLKKMLMTGGTGNQSDGGASENSSDEPVMCPMCEFQSPQRSVVMQHVVTAHGT